MVKNGLQLDDKKREVYLSYIATLLGRTFEEVQAAYCKFAAPGNEDRLFGIVYYLGRLSIEEVTLGKKREISFSANLRERIGHHIYGEAWASTVKNRIAALHLDKRPLHIVSANMHSVMNILMATDALESLRD